MFSYNPTFLDCVPHTSVRLSEVHSLSKALSRFTPNLNKRTNIITTFVMFQINIFL